MLNSESCLEIGGHRWMDAPQQFTSYLIRVQRSRAGLWQYAGNPTQRLSAVALSESANFRPEAYWRNLLASEVSRSPPGDLSVRILGAHSKFTRSQVYLTRKWRNDITRDNMRFLINFDEPICRKSGSASTLKQVKCSFTKKKVFGIRVLR